MIVCFFFCFKKRYCKLYAVPWRQRKSTGHRRLWRRRPYSGQKCRQYPNTRTASCRQLIVSIIQTNVNYCLPELFEAQLKSMTLTYKSFLQNIGGAGKFNLSELYYCWRNSLIVSIMYFRMMNLKILWSLM